MSQANEPEAASDQEDGLKFLDEYRSYVQDVLTPTHQEVKAFFKRWKEPSYWAHYTEDEKRRAFPTPIQRFNARIKRPESVKDKIIRKPDSFPQGLTPESFTQMRDAVAGRLVIYFMSYFTIVDREIRSHPELELCPFDPPVAYLREDLARRFALVDLERRDKPSGYASVHYILRLRSSSVPVEERPWFEIQLRTLAEDAWGEVEHMLGYKPGKQTSASVTSQFRIIGSHLTAIDEHFSSLYEDLSRFQTSVNISDTSQLNTENLPPVLHDLGVGSSQHEVFGLLKVLASQKVETIGDLRTLAHRWLPFLTPVFRSVEHREPSNFEIVATLANLSGCSTEADAKLRIVEQIAYLRVWHDLRSKGLA